MSALLSAGYFALSLGPGTCSGTGNKLVTISGKDLVVNSIAGPGAAIIDLGQEGSASELGGGVKAATVFAGMGITDMENSIVAFDSDGPGVTEYGAVVPAGSPGSVAPAHSRQPLYVY